MEEYFSELAVRIENSHYVREQNTDNAEKVVVDAAKNGSEKAQWICWAIFNAEQKIADDKVHPSNLINRYVSGILLKCQRTNQPISSNFPWIKKAENIREEHERMIHSYLLHLILKVIRELNDDCSMEIAIIALAEHAMQQTPVERANGKTKFFQRFNTISKLEKELKYYKRNYEKWAFLFETFVDLRFSHPFKFSLPSQYAYNTDLSTLFQNILVDLKV